MKNKKIHQRWLPPEGCGNKGTDEWMFGIFLWELFSHAARSTGRETSNYDIFPFTDLEDEELVSTSMFSFLLKCLFY